MILRGLAIWSSVGIGHLAVLGSLWSGSSTTGAGPAPLLLDLRFVPVATPASPASSRPQSPRPLIPQGIDAISLPDPASFLPAAASAAPASPFVPSANPSPFAPVPQPAGEAVAPSHVLATPPRFQARVEPSYPPRARRAGVEGVVTVRLRLSAEGRLLAAEVAVGSGEPLLDEAALAAARASRYAPATQGGLPVASETTADYRFELR